MAAASPRHVIVCGAGVIGASVAYFLTQRGIAVTVIERTGVACAASGKSGGFIALDWCDNSPLGPLARAGFALRAAFPAAASGTSGGFIALDWCDNSPLGPLARASFALHARLAREITCDYGYRRMDTYMISERDARALTW